MYSYNSPWNTEEYVHRVGRTGRAGEMGISVTVTLMTQGDWKIAGKLIKVLQRAHQRVPEDLVSMPSDTNYLDNKGTQKINQENLKKNPESFTDVYIEKLYQAARRFKICSSYAVFMLHKEVLETYWQLENI